MNCKACGVELTKAHTFCWHCGVATGVNVDPEVLATYGHQPQSEDVAEVAPVAEAREASPAVKRAAKNAAKTKKTARRKK